jgi:hypothetical protein
MSSRSVKSKVVGKDDVFKFPLKTGRSHCVVSVDTNSMWCVFALSLRLPKSILPRTVFLHAALHFSSHVIDVQPKRAPYSHRSILKKTRYPPYLPIRPPCPCQTSLLPHPMTFRSIPPWPTLSQLPPESMYPCMRNRDYRHFECLRHTCFRQHRIGTGLVLIRLPVSVASSLECYTGG